MPSLIALAEICLVPAFLTLRARPPESSPSTADIAGTLRFTASGDDVGKSFVAMHYHRNLVEAIAFETLTAFFSILEE